MVCLRAPFLALRRWSGAAFAFFWSLAVAALGKSAVLHGALIVAERALDVRKLLRQNAVVFFDSLNFQVLELFHLLQLLPGPLKPFGALQLNLLHFGFQLAELIAELLIFLVELDILLDLRLLIVLRLGGVPRLLVNCSLDRARFALRGLYLLSLRLHLALFLGSRELSRVSHRKSLVNQVELLLLVFVFLCLDLLEQLTKFLRLILFLSIQGG